MTEQQSYLTIEDVNRELSEFARLMNLSMQELARDVKLHRDTIPPTIEYLNERYYLHANMGLVKIVFESGYWRRV